MSIVKNTSLFETNDYTEVLSDLTILSMGCGQDSVTLLNLAIHDKDFRERYLPNGYQRGSFIVIFADTHEEAPHTYDYLERVLKPLCTKHDIEFVHITNDMGYHSPSWLSLSHQWKHGGTRHTIGSVAFNSTCTHQLKLTPQYRFVEEWLKANFDEVTKDSRKAGYVQFAKAHGKIRWLIGIAKGEERRVFDVNKETLLWKKQAIKVEYPLIDLGLDRQGCQDYLREIGVEIPFPSNCLKCHYATQELELLWLYKSYPDKFYSWAEEEQAKLDDPLNQAASKSVGVCGKIHKEGEKKGEAVTLLDLLNDALKKYPNISLNELTEFRFSHGHCAVSTY